MKITTWCEALAPDKLASIVRAGIESRLDLDLYRDVMDQEEQDRAALLAHVQSAGWR